MGRLIGFCGKPDSGKSTAARYLHEAHGFDWINISAPIKAMLEGFYRWCGLDDGEIERRLVGDLKETPDPLLNGKTPRYALQTLGYEWRDLISSELFSDRWCDRVIACGQYTTSDSMRYPNEMPALYRADGILVRIDRPGATDTTGHPAENQTLDPDRVIVNDGTIEDLFQKLDDLVTEVPELP